jgi:formate/nitrite transporter FocA (FNT family)
VNFASLLIKKKLFALIIEKYLISQHKISDSFLGAILKGLRGNLLINFISWIKLDTERPNLV